MYRFDIICLSEQSEISIQLWVSLTQWWLMPISRISFLIGMFLSQSRRGCNFLTDSAYCELWLSIELYIHLTQHVSIYGIAQNPDLNFNDGSVPNLESIFSQQTYYRALTGFNRFQILIEYNNIFSHIKFLISKRIKLIASISLRKNKLTFLTLINTWYYIFKLLSSQLIWKKLYIRERDL